MDPQERAAASAYSFVDKLNDVILFPLVTLLIAVAFLMFLYGCAEYIMNASNDKGREQGVKHITWGIVGLVVMVSAWAILSLATGTLGLDDELECAKDGSSGNCAEKFQVN